MRTQTRPVAPRVSVPLGTLMLAMALVATACVDELDASASTREKLRELANPGPPPNDASNQFIGDEAVVALGHAWYFDTEFSGYGTQENILGEVVPEARAGRGERMRISCATCHALDRGGVDPGDGFTNHVSIGAGAYDVNSMPTINSAYNGLVYWNGRNDSLWAQILAVLESRVSMFGSRNRVVWRIVDAYRDEYTAAFPDHPLPAAMDSIEAQIERLEPDGSCKLETSGDCPDTFCHEIESNDGSTHCLPRFPFQAQPGAAVADAQSQCDWGSDDPRQPFGDAYDCMDPSDQEAITEIYVNWAKAIAAYEYTLVMVDSPFDRWVASDFDATMLSVSARRGAALFVGKAACNECHSGPMMTDNAFHNVGVPQRGEFVPTLEDCPQGAVCDCVSDDTEGPTHCFPIGLRDGLRLLQSNGFRRDGVWSDDASCVDGRSMHDDASYAEENPEACGGVVAYYPVPVAEDTVGQWKTPSLRNVSLTGPYMHNGMFETLREVVEHYDGAAEEFEGEWLGTLDDKVVRLNLTETEIDDLVAFLESLEGEPLDPSISTPPSLPPDSPFPETSPF